MIAIFPPEMNVYIDNMSIAGWTLYILRINGIFWNLHMHLHRANHSIVCFSHPQWAVAYGACSNDHFSQEDFWSINASPFHHIYLYYPFLKLHFTLYNYLGTSFKAPYLHTHPWVEYGPFHTLYAMRVRQGSLSTQMLSWYLWPTLFNTFAARSPSVLPANMIATNSVKEPQCKCLKRGGARS